MRIFSPKRSMKNGLINIPDVPYDNKDKGDDHYAWKKHLDKFAQKSWQEDEEKYVKMVEVPGFKKEDLTVSLNDNTVKINGTKETEHWNRVVSETHSLPQDVDSSTLEATLNDGLLKLVVQKGTVGRGEEIKIKSE